MTNLSTERSCTVFAGNQILAQGAETRVREAIRRTIDEARLDRNSGSILAFYDDSGGTFDIEYAPTVGSMAPPATLDAQPARKPGRPRLGVIAREITLLPRHWEWLETQPGGASVALRKLVEFARRESGPADRIRHSIEAAYRFMSVMCGNAPGFEAASRALFRKDWEEFDRISEIWPADVRAYLHRLSSEARSILAGVST